jgi:hypothetical protein
MGMFNVVEFADEELMDMVSLPLSFQTKEERLAPLECRVFRVGENRQLAEILDFGELLPVDFSGVIDICSYTDEGDRGRRWVSGFAYFKNGLLEKVEIFEDEMRALSS